MRLRVEGVRRGVDMETRTGTILRRAAIVFIATTSIVVILYCTRLFLSDGGNNKENWSRMGCQSLYKACKAYQIQSPTGDYPKSLDDLVAEDRSFVEGGKMALHDRWGKPYQYTLVKDECGESIPFIWT